jgi:hypothetical protein
MPLDPKQRHKLLMADRTRDGAWITAAIEHLVAADPTVTLDEIEGALRDAAGSAYVIGKADKCEVVIGMQAWVAELDRRGRTPEQNRQRWRASRLNRGYAGRRRPCRCTKNTLGGSGETLKPWSQALQKMFRLIPMRGL